MPDQSFPRWISARHAGALIILVCGGVLALSGVAAAAEIRLTSDGFEPAEVQVEAGETIVWMNASGRTATIVGPDGAWDSGPLAEGETFSIALRREGTVRYATLDGQASGTLVVQGEAAPASGSAAVSLPQTGTSPLPYLVLAAALLALGAATLVRPRRTDPTADLAS